MILHWEKTKYDKKQIANIKKYSQLSTKQFDYRGVIVEKPWGYEYLLYQNAQTAIWIMHLQKDRSTSLHCHPLKITSLIVLNGVVQCSSLKTTVPRNSGEGVIINAGVFHRTCAISDGGAYVMEIETPPLKHNLLRIADQYGRTGRGYEGVSALSTEVHKYTYSYIPHEQVFQNYSQYLLNCHFQIKHHKKREELNGICQSNARRIVCLLQGRIYSKKRKHILKIGEAVSHEVFHKHEYFVDSDSIYLMIDYES